MKPSFLGRRFRLVVACGLLVAPLVASMAEAEITDWTFRELNPVQMPEGAPTYDVDLVVDDGTAEGAFGVGVTAARQFLWFQRFSPPRDIDLEEIQILFPLDPEIVPGSSIEIVVYQDVDGDPTNGAELMTTRTEVVQVADGTSFSNYPLDPVVEFRDGGTLLVGIINRYVVSGITPSHEPAALDTSTSAQRSWVATWSGDPPEPPLLPPDQAIFLVDQIVPGNWMIRAYGSAPAVVVIPTVDGIGLALLVLLLGAFGCRRAVGLRSRTPVTAPSPDGRSSGD